MNHKVLFFATLRDRAGLRQTEVDLPDGMRVADLKQLLVERFPGLRPSLPTMLVAINREFAQDDALIPAGAELAVFPPVSGG
jgi:molybdopterin converting factor subunit 1